MTTTILTHAANCETTTVVNYSLTEAKLFTVEGNISVRIYLNDSPVALLDQVNTTYVAYARGDYRLEAHGACNGGVVKVSTMLDAFRELFEQVKGPDCNSDEAVRVFSPCMQALLQEIINRLPITWLSDILSGLNNIVNAVNNIDGGVGGGSTYTQADVKQNDCNGNLALRVFDACLGAKIDDVISALNTLNASQQVRTTEFFSQESSVSQNLVASDWQSVSIEFIEGTGTINGITYPKIANGYVLSGLEWQANMNGSNSNVIAIVADAASSYIISGVRYV